MIHLVAGTRPEIIKLAPVYRWLDRNSVDVEWLWTGQQVDMIDTFDVFDQKPDYKHKTVRNTGSLQELFSELTSVMNVHLMESMPDIMVVQGDTLTSAVAAQAAFLARIPVAHVEAGLRTYDLERPFPEEACRVWIDDIATWKFAPTEKAMLNLSGRAYLTGNTGIDATRMVKKKRIVRGEYVVITMHRRENLDALHDVIAAAKELIANGSVKRLVWVAHPNPAIREVLDVQLGTTSKVRIIDPQPYDNMVNLIRNAKLCITDSGGLQEECLALSTPVLVMRESTERPEGVENGGAMLVGTDTQRIVAWATYLLGSSDELDRMSSAPNPYGDGYAASRIGRVLKGAIHGQDVRPADVTWKVRS